MTHTNKAIYDSIDAGYRLCDCVPLWSENFEYWFVQSHPMKGYVILAPAEFFMDKSWWECLARARKWRNGFRVMNRKILGEYKSPPEYYWHKMIAHIAAGGNYESYFETICP